MNSELQSYARKYLKEGLSQCPKPQQDLFKKMYAKGNRNSIRLSIPIDDVVDKMDEDKLDWAMFQVKRAVEKNNG